MASRSSRKRVWAWSPTWRKQPRKVDWSVPVCHIGRRGHFCQNPHLPSQGRTRCRLAIFSITPRRVAYATAALVALSLAGATLERRHGADLEQATRDLRAAQSISHAAIAQADSERHYAQLDARSAFVAIARADSAEHREIGLRARLAAARAVDPAPCAPVYALADSALDAADLTIAGLRSANQSLKAALDSTDAAVSHLRASQVNLDAKASVLVDVVTPHGWSRLASLRPKTGVGIVAGINPVTGQPGILVGVTFGWSR